MVYNNSLSASRFVRSAGTYNFFLELSYYILRIGAMRDSYIIKFYSFKVTNVRISKSNFLVRNLKNYFAGICS